MTFGAVQMTVLIAVAICRSCSPAAPIPMAGDCGGRSDFCFYRDRMDAERVACSSHRCGVSDCRMEAQISTADSTSADRGLVHRAPSVRARVISIYQPHGDLDSNLHRNITRRVGIEMIKAHPWFGIGPEMPGKEFDRYLPPDIKQPLPHGFYGHLHNVYLQFGAERGIPALIAFLWMIGKMLTDWWRRTRSMSPPKPSDPPRVYRGSGGYSVRSFV